VKVAYQGTPGGHSEDAAAALFPEVERAAERTFADVFAALSSAKVRAAVVPVENTLAGSVVDVYDLLRAHEDLTVLGEVAIPVDDVTSLDEPSATRSYTRFFAVARRGDHDVADAIAPVLGVQKTSIVYATKNIPGALVRSLQPFATAGIQMTKIESRPSRNAPWQYVFYLDFEGHPSVSPAREALALMATCCEWIHVIGTYRSTSTTAAEIAS
jgi:prephenate dehydratase